MATAIWKESTEPSFNPTFFQNCNLWLDGSDSSSLTLSSGKVTEWRDKSGRSNHAVPNTGLTGLSTMNLVQCLSFSNTSFQGSISNTGTTLTSFVVATMAGATNSNGRLLSCGLSTESDNAGASSVTLLNRLLTNSQVYSTRTNVNTTIFNVSLNTPFIISTHYTGSQNAIFLNGTQQGNSANVAGTFGYNRYRVGDTAGSGGAARWTGLVGEVVIFNASLTLSQRQAMEGYLAWKWGQVANLPSNHPFKNYSPSFVPPIPSASITYPLLSGRNSKPAPYFDPRTITSCRLWLDGADPSATGIQPSQNSSVSNWIDKSSGRNNAVSSGASIPTFTSGGGIGFNGSGSYNTNFTSSPDTQSFFVIYRWTSITTAQTFIAGTKLKQIIFYVDPPNSRWPYLGGIATWGRWNTSALTSNVTYIAAYTFSASPGTAVLYLNGNTLPLPGSISGPQSVAATPTTSVLGSQFNGTMYEIIGFNTILSTTDRQNIEGYLAWKWGAQANLPTNHPFRAGPPTPLRQLSLPFQIKTAKWQPTQISNCILWLDGQDITKVGVSGINVTAWNDKSGLNNNLTTISSPAPTYSSSTGAIKFTGADGINTGTSIRGALNTTYTNPISTFIVCSIRLDPNAIYNPRLINFGTNGTTATYFAGQFVVIPFASTGSTPAFCTYANNNQDPTGQGTNLQTYVPTSFSKVGIFENISNYSGTTLTLNTFLNGNTSTFSSRTTTWSVSAPYVTTMSYVSLGANTNGSTYVGDDFSGDMYEVITFSRSLSVSERQLVEGYLAWKWKLVGDLPSTHPYKLFPPSP